MRNPAHILHIIDSLALGGAERMVVEIANSTDKTRFEVSVCVTRQDTTLANFLNPDIRLLVLDRRNRFEWSAFRKLSIFMKAHPVDLLHIHTRSSLPLIALIMQMGLIPRVPIVFTDHYEAKNAWSFMEGLTLYLVRPYYVGVCDELVQTARKIGIARQRSVTIPNTIDFMPYRTISDQPLSLKNFFDDKFTGPIGIQVSNIRPIKDIDLLIQALARIKHLEWGVVVVGALTDSSYSAACQRTIQELSLENRIKLIGPRSDVLQLLKAADFGILTSRSETGPVVLIEYLAAGLPFVSTRVGYIGEYLDRLGIPEIIEPQNVRGLATALECLVLASPYERAKRGEMGREAVENRFDISQAISSYHKVYELNLPKSL